MDWKTHKSVCKGQTAPIPPNECQKNSKELVAHKNVRMGQTAPKPGNYRKGANSSQEERAASLIRNKDNILHSLGNLRRSILSPELPTNMADDLKQSTEVPTRPIQIDGVIGTLRLTDLLLARMLRGRPSKFAPPATEYLLYHGIIGEYDKPDTEAFRILLKISRRDLLMLNLSMQSTCEQEELHFSAEDAHLYTTLFDTVNSIITANGARKHWACVVCGRKEDIIFNHATVYHRSDVVPDRFASCWDFMLPFCASEDRQCVTKLSAIREGNEANHGAAETKEMEESYVKGVKKYFEVVFDSD